jgi:hypothetical protein
LENFEKTAQEAQSAQRRKFAQSSYQGCVFARVARWHIFKPKILIWVYYGGSCNGRYWYILWPFGIFYSHVVYFVDIWCILWLFGIFCPVLVRCTKKNLATLVSARGNGLRQLPKLVFDHFGP